MFIADQSERPAGGAEASVAERLASLERSNGQLLEMLREGVYQVDLTGQIVYANPAASRLLGWHSPQQLIGRSEPEIVYGDPLADPVFTRMEALASGATQRNDHETFRHRDGHAIAVSVSCAPLLERAAIVGALCAFCEVTAEH